jgi:hypothetical protein
MGRLLLTVIGGILGGFLSSMFFASQPVQGSNGKVLQAHRIDLLDKKGGVAVTISVDDFMPGEAGIVFSNSNGKQFCLIQPGVFTVKYSQRKGGGSFLVAGPGWSGSGGGCELQMILPDNKQGTGPNISLRVSASGRPWMQFNTPTGETIMSVPRYD